MARTELVAFTRYTFGQYRPAPHHYAISQALEAVERGEIKRLMIFMPPRHGKSELASKRFPAWFIGRNPQRNIIAASYNSDLAADFGREVRNIVAGQPYANLFESRLSEDSTAANRWHTDKGGMYVAAGVGTATTGRGAHVLLIDDPFKDRQEADSEVTRERVWRWYTSTAYTRLESDIDPTEVLDDDWLWRDLLSDIESGAAQKFEGAVVVIQTRWHEDDLAGRLLQAQQQGGDEWHVIELSAVRESANERRALWPAKYSLAQLDKIRKAIGERDWSALYQQRPAPDEGVYFKREWFRYYDELPKHLEFYGGSDYAVTAKGGDNTVHAVAGVDADDNLYIADLWTGQTESNVWIEAFLDLVNQYQPMGWGEEQGQIIKSLGPFIEQRSRERRIYCYREQFVSVMDKPTRCRSFQARMAMGKVYFPRNAPWLADCMNELLSFPAGRTDDRVDALGLVGRLLDKMIGGREPKPKEPNNANDYRGYSSDDGDVEDSWRVA